MNPKDYTDHIDPPKLRGPKTGTPNTILSIVIPCRAETWPVLLMTLQGIQEDCLQLEKTYGKNSWECIIVFNALPGESCAAETRFKECNLRTFGNFRYVHMNKVSMGSSKNAGAYAAVGEYVYFGDSHMTFCRDFFSKLINTYRQIQDKGSKIGILHSSLGWMSGVHSQDVLNAYTPEIKKWFWGSWYKRLDREPYPVCMMGTSFLFERRVFNEIGGYNENFMAYGGDEAYINLKTWRLGYSVFVDPNTYVWHLADQRGYSWTNDDLWFNTMLASYTIGGLKWLDNQVNNYKIYLTKNHTGIALRNYTDNLDALVAKVIGQGNEDHIWINSKAEKTLDELMQEHGWE